MSYLAHERNTFGKTSFIFFVKRSILPVLFFFFSLASNGQTYTSVAVTGFTADVIANGPTLASSVTADVDGGGFYFLNQSFTAYGAPTYFLPNSGAFVSTAIPGLPFQLASATGNNSLRLVTQNASGSLTLTTPVNAGIVYLLATSGTGASTIDVTVNFTDATSQTFTGQSIPDWFGGAANVTAIAAIGRVNNTALGGTAADPRLYQIPLALTGANLFKPIASITVTKTNVTGTGFAQIMGVSVAAPCAPPTAQATSLNLTAISTSQINGSFTAASPAADQYLVVRYPSGAATTAPVNGTNYTSGAALGSGTVVQSTNTTSFSATGLNGNLTYDFYVYAFNNTNCIGPVYSVNPLTGSQATQSCPSLAGGTYTVGPTGTYATLTAALTALGNGSLGNVILELQSTYTSAGETFPITFTSGACLVTALTIRPAAGATSLSITSSNATATIDINNFKNLTIDGRPGGIGTTSQLSVINTATTGVAIRFINDAQNNTITYCDVQGQNTSATSSATANSGVIYFGGTTTAALLGNDNNTVSFCSIHGVGINTPAMGISSTGTITTTVSYNDNNTITNNNIYDYFSATLASTGLKTDAGNSAWTITGNSFYQTVSPRAITTAAITHRGLWITPNGASLNPQASGFIITGNYIGGMAPNAGGSAYTVTNNTTAVFLGMDLSPGLGTPTSIQGNTIQNIAFTTTTTANPSFAGISVANGHVNIGTVTGNVIGSGTGAGSISITNTTSNTGTSYGIRLAGGTTTTMDCRNNTVGSFTIVGSGTIQHNFIGIGAVGGTTINVTISNNTIGSTSTANSINLSSASTGTGSITGIAVTAGASTSVVNANTVANLNNNSTATATAQTRGIVVSVGVTTITNNTVRNLSNVSAQTGSGSGSAVVGIAMTSASAGHTVSGNTIHSLSATSASTTAAVQITGLFYSGTTTGTNTVAKNFIHSFDVTAVNPSSTITGIDIGGGTSNFINNMIRLGIRPDGSGLTTALIVRGISIGTTSTNSIYFNTVYIGGTGVGTTANNTYGFNRSATSGSLDIRNNIFINARSNATTGGKHYTINLAASTTVFPTFDYNVYLYSGTGGVFANNGTADVSAYAAGWIAGDTHSYAVDPFLVNPTGNATAVDLHLQIGSIAEGTGIDIPAVTDDYDGQIRSTLSPVDIGADAGNYGYAGVDVGASVLVAPVSNSCYTSTQSVIVRVRNYSSNPINFATNNVTVTATATGPVTYSSSTVLSTGTLASGATIDVTMPATINMTANGTYVFNAGTTATGDLNGVNNAISSQSFLNQVLGGSYNVGAGQAATGGFNTLTTAVAAYNAANCITGPVVFNLTDASYGAGETFPISINANAAAGTNTLTIKPASGVTTTISGSSASAIIKLNGADYIIIDGSNNGSATRDLTITNTNTAAATGVIWMSSLGAGAGTLNDVVKNVNLSAGADQSTGTNETFGILSSGTSLATGNDGIDNNNITIQNNSIIKVRWGIFMRGGSSAPGTNLVINNNIVGPAAFGSNEIGKGGIIIQNQINASVISNEVRFVGGTFSTTTGGADRMGIGVGGFDGPTTTSTLVSNSIISKNNIHDIVEERTFSSLGIIISSSSSPSNNIIANNFINNVRANGTGGDQGISLDIAAGNGDKVVFNTVRMISADIDPAGATTATESNIGIRVVGTTVSNLTLADNISSVDVGSNTATLKHFAIVVSATSYPWGTGFIDNNDYYVNSSNTQMSLGGIGTTATITPVATIAAWKIQFTPNQDANSLNVQPPFVSSTDLHIDAASAAAFDDKGTPVGVTTDIDGDLRNTVTPDIGADEFTVATGVDLGVKLLVSPIVKNCYSNAETVTVRLRNYSANPHNLASLPATLNASVTGTNPTVFAPVVVNTGIILPGDSIDVVLTNSYNMTAVGTYTFDAFSVVSADVNAANNAMTSTARTLAVITPGTVSASNTNYCLSGTPTLTLIGANNNIQWQQSVSSSGPWTNVGTNSTTYTPSGAITTTTYYQAVVSCNVNSATSNVLQVAVNNPQLLTTVPGSRCGPGSVTLSGTASAGTAINWYTAASGGLPLATGNLFASPIINANTTYYASASSPATSSDVGLSPTATNCGTIASSTATDWPLRFNTTAPLTINSTYVIPVAAGTLTVALRNSLSATDIQTTSFTFTAGQVGVPQLITLNYAISTPGSYQLTNTVGGAYRIATFGCAYPFTSAGGAFSIVGSATTSTAATSTTQYNAFFQLNVSEACESARQAVLATVNPGPAFDVTNNTSLCNGSILPLTVLSPPANFNSVTWAPTAGLFTDASATIAYTGGNASTVYVKQATAGLYTYVATGINSTTSCSGIDSVKVTVLPATLTIAATTPQICVSGTTTLFVSTPAGFGNATYQWLQSPTGTGYTTIAGATSSSYTTPVISAAGFYQVIIKDGQGNSCLQPTINVTVNNPQVLTTTPATNCAASASVTLQATGSAGTTLNWYTAASGGTPVGAGVSFTTPTLTGPTTYYVSATSGNYILGGFGKPATNGTDGTASTTGIAGHLKFDALSAFTLNSVVIYPAGSGTGTVTIAYQDAAGATLTTSGPITVTGYSTPTPVTIPLGFAIGQGTQMRLALTGITGGVTGLYRDITGNAFPYTLPNVASITDGSTAGTYFYFFSWSLSTSCTSARVPVQALVNAPTGITQQPVSQSVCSGTNVTLSVTATGANLTYQWFNGASAITGATNSTYAITNATTANTGTYSVVVTGACGTPAAVTSNTVTLFVAPANGWLGAVSSDWNNPANWCGGVPTSTTDATIAAGALNYPVINGVADVRNITVNTGATLTLTPGASFNIYGNYANSGTVTASSGFIFFRGAANQTVSSLTAANVVINGAGGITAGGNLTIGTLILQNGNITLGNNNLTVTGSVNGTANSHVVTNGTGTITSNNINAGPVIIPVGSDAATYDPVIIANGQGRNYTVKIVTGISPAITDNNRAINRTWTITPSSAVPSNVSLTLQFADAHGNSLFVPGALAEVGQYTGTAWAIASPPNGVAPLGAATERQVTIQTSAFGPFVVASPGGIQYPTAIPSVNPDITRIMLMPNAIQKTSVLRIVSTRATKMNFTVVDAGGKQVRTFVQQLNAGTNDIPLDFSTFERRHVFYRRKK
jgi:hypothetical protein